ncbi:MAG: transcription antitermination factor NusB [Bacteroidetes bacterium]|nr:transcription antitermination factor NusB [Bacteroidota bacterium]
MQTLYAYRVLSKDYDLDIQKYEESIQFVNTDKKLLDSHHKFLIENIHMAYRSYLLNLYTIREVCLYEKYHLQADAAKHLPVEQEQEFPDYLSQNKIVTALNSNTKLNMQFKEEKVSGVLTEKIIRNIFRKTKSSKFYNDHIAKNKGPDGDLELVAKVYKKTILASSEYNQVLDELSIGWQDDKQIIASLVLKTLEAYDEAGNKAEPFDAFNSKKSKEDESFVTDLYFNTIEKSPEFKELIGNQVKNWDLSRITVIDGILLQMALCEMLYFEMIPLKVTIDEYIEISKKYSTPKSKEFINGILDKLMKTLSEEGRIKKKGRGRVST